MGTTKKQIAAIRKKYIAGQYKNLRDAAEQNTRTEATAETLYGRIRKAAGPEGWNKKRAAREQKTEDRAIEKIVEAEAEIIARKKREFMEAGEVLLTKGLKKLKAKGTKLQPNEALSAVSRGITIQRDVLGLKGADVPTSPADPVTVHDKAISDMSIEQRAKEKKRIEAVLAVSRKK